MVLVGLYEHPTWVESRGDREEELLI
jgi:hypothetical protein